MQVRGGNFLSAAAQGVALVAVCLLITPSNFAFSANQDGAKNVRASEAFIDAFYSFDPAKLRALLTNAPESAPFITYYQGWAEGGNYRVLKRAPCEAKELNQVECAITVEDDLMKALGIDFNVTDTFHLTFVDGKISAVKTSSNDLPMFMQAMEWVYVRGLC
jgi:hypothetical protein